MENHNISVIRSYLESGRSVCPFAKKCQIHYVLDTGDMKSILTKFDRKEAIIVVCSRPSLLVDFTHTRTWARHAFLKAIRQSARVTYSDVSDKEIAAEIATTILPILQDDDDRRRPNIALKEKPVITICMAPVYPVTHPRYAPVPILVLTWFDDLTEAGTIPKVRQAMTQEHGYVYDALELMLPLPK